MADDANCFTARSALRRHQWLGFTVGALQCALPAKRIGSVIRVDIGAAAPSSPGRCTTCVQVGDLLVPLKDLGAALGTGRSMPASRAAALLVVLPGPEKRPVVLGLLVDEVHSLYDLGPDEIEPPASGLFTLAGEMAIGLGRSSSRQMLLLDLDTLVTEDERALAAMLNHRTTVPRPN
jgi:purine-binding chemotaxis protein CheW